MNAQERGAVGTIIYSDPEQDGSRRGPTYPAGGWRPSSSVQRGSVQFNSRCAGDPARAANPRPVEEVCGFRKEELVPTIPVMPISVRRRGGRGGAGEVELVGCGRAPFAGFRERGSRSRWLSGGIS